MSDLYATCSKTPQGYRAQIFENGVGRHVREAKDTITLAKMLLEIRPNLEHVMTSDNGVQDTGALTLGECLEAIAL